MNRIEKIDIVRGLVMIIMALDHVRDIIHVDSLTQNPTDLNTTTPALFFTRWITHLCAPAFVFLAGTSAFFYKTKRADSTTARSYLLKRGLVLIFLEFTVVNLGMFFDPGFHTLIFQVIGTIGFGMIILSFLIQFNPKYIGIAGLVITLLHNISPLIQFSENSVLRTILTPFFSPAAFPILPGKTFIMGYPPIPWLGILLLGYGSGFIFTLNNNRIFFKIGIGSIIAFLIIRTLNIYGDSVPWSSQKDSLFTFLSFINLTKYPPSLQFTLLMLGIIFLITSVTEKLPQKIRKILLNFGRAPLFYFIVHFYLIHILSLGILFYQGFHWSDLNFAGGTFGRPSNQASGLTLPLVYLMWISVVIIMYFPTKWFAGFKASHTYFWLKYI